MKEERHMTEQFPHKPSFAELMALPDPDIAARTTLTLMRALLER